MSNPAPVYTFGIPGAPGTGGIPGVNGTNGKNAFTRLAAPFTMPAYGASGVATVEDSSSFIYYQPVFVEQLGTLQVVGIPDGTSLTLKNLADGAGAYSTNAIPTTVAALNSLVTAGGLQGPSGAVAGGALLAANNLSDVVSPATSRSSLGLGTIATQNANNVNISGGSIVGITDLLVADGGTGASTAAGARTNLGLGTMAVQDANAVAITGGTAGTMTLVQAATLQSTLAMFLSGTFYLTPANASLLAASAIPVVTSKVRVVGNGGAVTLTSTPSIDVPLNDGQLLLLLGTSDVNTVTLQSEASLAGTQLRLGAATRLLGEADQLLVCWDATLALWCEVSFVNN